MTVMGTITDTPNSVDLSGHSVEHPSSTSTSSSIDPRNKFQYTAGVTSTPNPLAAPHDSQTLPPARPGKARTRQASRCKSVTENSAARCRVILGQDRTVNKKQVYKAQSQPESTLVGDNVNFQYSARNPATGVSSSATRTARSRVRVRQVYRRNVAVRAIDKKGSYVHYLGRQFKLLKSKMASYADDVDKEINLVNSKIDSCTHDLNREMNLLNAKIAPYTHDLKRKIQLLTSKIDSYCHDIGIFTIRMNVKMHSCSQDVGVNFKKLKSKIGPYIRDVDWQMELMDTKLAACKQDFNRKLDLVYSNAEQFFKLKKKIRKLLNKMKEI